MRRLIACLVLAGCHGSAVACLNDNELPSHEREFRSQYRGPEFARRAPTPAPGRAPRLWLWTAGGTGLLAGAVVVAFSASRPRS